EDDAPLVEALRRRGIEPVVQTWDRARFDGIAAALVRSTWDYTWRHQEFLAWAGRVPVPLWNPPSVLRWNSHKRYLADLAARGAPRVTPAEDVLAAARKVLSLVEPLLYARVDLARGLDGAPLLMELEAFEPSLFLRACPQAADRLAAAIQRRL